MKLNPFSTEAIALQQRPPSGTARMVSASICLMAFITVIYTSLASVDIVVTAQGKVIPSGKSKVIQPLEPGVVRSIAVKDGQKVKAGELLVELDATNTGADRDRLQREYWEAQADVARVSATLSGTASLVLDKDVPQEIANNQRAMLASRLAEHRSRLASLQADLVRRQADRDGVAATLTQLRTARGTPTNGPSRC
jgi:hemolysin D